MIIGIINRIDKTLNNDVYVYNKELCDYFISKNIIVLGIMNYDDNLLKLCNGFILPGGDNKTIDFKIIEYAYKNDIPILGICLGMQSMAEYFNGKLILTKDHYSKNKYVHQIIIKKNSHLEKILGKRIILVNSRHNYSVLSTDIDISSYSSSFEIESIEDSSKKFFIGLEWHPESLNDINSIKIFESFIKSCGEK